MMERIKSAEEAGRFLTRVQGFREGFIQELTVTSRDSFAINGLKPSDIGHVCTGEFDVRIIMAHHPARVDGAPIRTITRCVFKHVTEIHVDFRRLNGFEWPLEEVRIDTSLDTRGLRLLCRWKCLTKENAWEEYTQCLFSFQELEAVTLHE